jgi:hypothetical protein
VKDNAIPYARLGRKLLLYRQSLGQWIAKGGDRANRVSTGAQRTLDRLPSTLNSGHSRIASPRS